MNDPLLDSIRRHREELLREAQARYLGKRLRRAQGSGVLRVLSRKLERVSRLLR
jgi:hypothetical protein